MWVKAERFYDGGPIDCVKTLKVSKELKCHITIHQMDLNMRYTIENSQARMDVLKSVSKFKNEDFDPRSTANATVGTDRTAVGRTQMQTVGIKQTVTYPGSSTRREIWSMTVTIKSLPTPVFQRASQTLDHWKSHLLVCFEDELPVGIRCGSLRAVTRVRSRDRFQKQERVEIQSNLLELLELNLANKRNGKV